MPLDGKIENFVQTKPELSALGKVCRRAADLIEQNGWCQRAYRRDSGEFCATGAMYAAMEEQGYWPRWEHMQKAGGFTDSAPRSWTEWNDERGRTSAEVIARLRSVS